MEINPVEYVTAMLREILESDLSDLSLEISDTDREEYRKSRKIKGT